MRVPLAVNLESRQGSDDLAYPGFGDTLNVARVVNGIIEVKGEKALVRKRPGFVSLGQIRAGVGQLLWNWNGIRAIVDDYINSGTIASIVSAPTSSSLSPSNADLKFSAANTGSGVATPRMMFKNRSQAWTMNRAGTVSSVSYGGTMGSETFSVVSLTRSGTVATGTVSSDLPYNIGESVTIAGAVEGAYNGTVTLTNVTPGVYTSERIIPITITRSGTTATATTVSGPHGLTTGTAYTIAGANDAAYNGSKTITSTGADTFTYTVTVTGAGTTTWNPADKSANITLSGGDLVATDNLSDGGYYGVRGTVSKTAGKWYWEVTVGSGLPSSAAVQIGVAKNTHTLAAFLGSAAGGWSYGNTGGRSNEGSSTVGWGATFTSGDVIGVALDMDSGKLSFYKNGALVGESATGITGTIFPAVSLGVGRSVTMNFGGSAFAHTAPSGFAALNSDSPASPASGSITVTDPAVSTPATFSYTVGGSPSTPATGTITVQGSGGTVPGIAYINGYFVVMDTAGTIWNSAIDDPTSWGALDFLIAQNDSSRGAGIAVSKGYLLAFKEWTTELFYDASNATGSPFSPVDSGILQIGCASGWSIASIDDLTFWMSQTNRKGRGVHVIQGLESRKVSTPDVDRILDDADLTTVHAFCIKVEGHSLYVLTCAPAVAPTERGGFTLVYDSTTDIWYEWNSQILGASESAITTTVATMTRSGSVASVSTAPTPHGIVDGQGVKIAGATQNEYNGLKQARYVSATAFEFDVDGAPTTPATTGSTITVTYTVARRLPFVGATTFADAVLLLHESTGKLYAIEDATFTDEGYAIDFIIRTPRFDGGTMDRKSLSTVDLITAGTVVDEAAIRWSDDDFATVTKFRMVDLSKTRPQLRRCGAFERRAFEVKHVGSTSPILEALEMDFRK